jgi:hypothetical protein
MYERILSAAEICSEENLITEDTLVSVLVPDF